MCRDKRPHIIIVDDIDSEENRTPEQLEKLRWNHIRFVELYFPSMGKTEISFNNQIKKMKKKIYIAGKVTGLPRRETFLKFKKAELAVAASGFSAINPIEVVNDENALWNVAMKACIKALIDCDAVLFLPCFINSKGAQIEFELAKDMDIKVFHSLEDLKAWNN